MLSTKVERCDSSPWLQFPFTLAKAPVFPQELPLPLLVSVVYMAPPKLMDQVQVNLPKHSHWFQLEQFQNFHGNTRTQALVYFY